MTDFVNNFHFLRPWYLLFLILPFLLYLKKVNFGNTLSSWENICDKHLLNFLLVNHQNSKKYSFKNFIYLGLFTASIAVAGPSWKKVDVPAFEIENPNMFVLSLAQDMYLTDVSPSRLDRAKFLIQDIIKDIKTGQFGLEVYSLEPYVISPITDDSNLVINLLPQINHNIMPDHGDRLDRAIEMAIKRFLDAKYLSGNIILFTSDIGQRFDLALSAVDKAKKLNYTVNIVDTSFSGNEKLQLLAKNGNGIYLMAKKGDIAPIIDKLSQATNEKSKISKNLRSNFEDFGYYLIFIPIFCLLMFFRRGVLILLFMICISFNAQAGFWLNNNQEGLKLFNEQRFDEALQKFNDPLWKSVVLYKQNKIDDALKEIDKNDDEISLYNKGVFLTKLCKYDEAKKIFEEVLKKYPDNDNAKYNKKVLDELFLRAKENPSVLECGENQQQNNNQDNNKNENNEDEQSKEKNNNSQNNQDNSNDEMNKNSSDEKNKQSDKEQQEQEKNKNNDKQKEKKDNNSEDKSNSKEANNDNKDKNNNNNDGKNRNESNENKNNENGNQKTDKDKNKEGNTNNDTDKKENDEQNTNQGTEDVDASVMNAKETNEEEEFNEEAMVLQRRYREIPDDTGGLLREFIKKEHLKDRYSDENI